jgi:hypothetical protein
MWNIASISGDLVLESSKAYQQKAGTVQDLAFGLKYPVANHAYIKEFVGIVVGSIRVELVDDYIQTVVVAPNLLNNLMVTVTLAAPRLPSMVFGHLIQTDSPLELSLWLTSIHDYMALLEKLNKSSCKYE